MSSQQPSFLSSIVPSIFLRRRFAPVHQAQPQHEPQPQHAKHPPTPAYWRIELRGDLSVRFLRFDREYCAADFAGDKGDKAALSYVLSTAHAIVDGPDGRNLSAEDVRALVFEVACAIQRIGFRLTGTSLSEEDKEESDARQRTPAPMPRPCRPAE